MSLTRCLERGLTIRHHVLLMLLSLTFHRQWLFLSLASLMGCSFSSSASSSYSFIAFFFVFFFAFFLAFFFFRFSSSDSLSHSSVHSSLHSTYIQHMGGAIE